MPVLHQKLSSTSPRSATIHQGLGDAKESQTQLLTLQQENARLNDRVNQIRSASASMDINNLGFAQQLLTSKFELRRARTEDLHMRSSGINLPKLETQKIFKIKGKNIFLHFVTVFGNRPRLTDLSSSLEQQNWRQSVFNLYWRARKML